jgi:hypothetical protein
LSRSLAGRSVYLSFISLGLAISLVALDELEHLIDVRVNESVHVIERRETMFKLEKTICLEICEVVQPLYPSEHVRLV